MSMLLLAHGVSNAQNAEPWREVDQLMAQWNTLERQNAAIQSSWRQREPLLRLQLELLEQEKKTLSEFIESRRRSNDEIDEQRQQLAAEQVTLESHQDALELALVEAEKAMRALVTLLPPPLADVWEEKMLSLDADQNINANERLQLLVGLVNTAIEFDQRVTLHNTSMDNNAGDTVAVTQIYLGLAQGWFRSADGQLTGFGSAGVDAWQWQVDETPNALLANMLSDVLEMLDNPSLAAPVSLPVNLGQRP
ncbi:MAG: DUF3450 family protein [Pseudomonadota bacterium]